MIYMHKGFQYIGGIDQRDDGCDGDGCPIILEVQVHEVLTPSGETIRMDWSQWSDVTEADFRLWVDLNCPKRYPINGYCGPLNSDSLLALAVDTAHA